MRYIRMAVLAILALCLLTVTIANREPVTLRLLPGELAGFLGVGFDVTLPLFLVILLGVIVGLLIGFVWEWMREHQYRRVARREYSERVELEREVKTLRTPKPGSGDEVLAILEKSNAAR